MDRNFYSASLSESGYMNNENEKAKQQLISILKARQAVLFAGAGCSKVAGYPLWDELLIGMIKDLTPSLSKPQNIDNMAFADIIKNQMIKEAREKEYYKYLEKCFKPRNDRNHTNFHCALVQLGFSGIITTNYDILLETAVGESFSTDSFYLRCDPIDLCLPKPYRVFDFLRNLSPNTNHSHVLHIHGYYENTENIILTERDYLKKYGQFDDTFEQSSNRILDTIHRKVIWSILATHPIVFVGFSMDDEFFMRMLNIVQQDFELGYDPVYFSIMGYGNNEDLERTLMILKKNGVVPIFYHAPKPSPLFNADHSGLERLVFDIADKVGVQIGCPSLQTITQRMLER